MNLAPRLCDWCAFGVVLYILVCGGRNARRIYLQTLFELGARLDNGMVKRAGEFFSQNMFSLYAELEKPSRYVSQ